MVTKLYQIFCLSACLAACTKTASGFFVVTSDFIPLNTIAIIWNIHCLVALLISFKIAHVKYGAQSKAFNLCNNKIRPDMEMLGMVFPEDRIKRRQKLCLFIAFGVFVFSVGGLTLLSTDVFSDGFGSFMTAPFPKSAESLAIMVCLAAIVSYVWIIPAFYIILISTSLAAMFEVFNAFLKTEIKRNTLIPTPGRFKKIRLLHLQMCKMVFHLDKDFRYYFAEFFVFGISDACYILYHLTKAHGSINGLLINMYVFWLLSSLGFLGAISVFAALVNESVSIHFFIIAFCKTHETCVICMFSGSTFPV